MKPLLFAVLMTIVLGGSAFARRIDPHRLEIPRDQTPYSLGATHNYSVKIGKSTATYTLQPGVYTPELQGPDGLYLRCATGCVEAKTEVLWKSRQPEVIVMHLDGGVFLPNDANVGASIYFYAQAPHVEPGSGLLVSAIITAGSGKIMFPRDWAPSMVLRSRIMKLSK